MVNIAFDCETTGVNPYCSEIIEAYFKRLDNGDSYYFKSKVVNWSEEAELIHGISEFKTLDYPNKQQALKELVNWLPNNFRFISYVNKNTELGHLNFDVAILKNELHLYGYHRNYLELQHSMQQNISVIDLLRKAVRNNKMSAPKNDKNRTTYKMELMYYHLFHETYDAHNCVDDVNAMLRIYNYVKDILNENSFKVSSNKTNKLESLLQDNYQGSLL